MNNRGKIALMEIMVLVIGIVAIGWALGRNQKIFKGKKTIKPIMLPSDLSGSLDEFFFSKLNNQRCLR